MAGAQQGRGGCGRHAQRGRGGSHGFSAPRAPRQHGGPGLLGADPSSQPPAQVQPPVVPLPSEKRDPTPPAPASSSPSSHVKAPPVSDPVKNYNGDGGITAVAKMYDDAQDDVLVGLSGSSTAATGKKRLLPLHNDEEAEDASNKKKIRLAWGEGLAMYENRQYKDDETTHKLVAHDGATGQTASSHGSSPPAGSKGHCDNNSLLDHMAKIRVSHVTTAPGLFSKGSSTLPRTGDLSDPGKKESISSLTNKEVVSPAGYIGDLPIIFPKVFAVPRKGSPPPEDNSSSSSGKTPIALSAFASSTQGCDAPPDESSMEFMKVQDAQKCLPTTVMQSQENCPNENDAAPLLSGIATIKVTKNFERTKAKEEDVKKPVNQILHESTANLLAHSLPDKGHGESSMDENEHVTGKVLVGESNAAPSSLAMKSSHSDCLTISEIEAPMLENFNEDSCPNEAVCITKSSSMVMENVPQSVLIANHGDEGNCVAGGSCGQDNLKITFFPDERSAKPASGTIEGDQIRSGAKPVELCSSMKARNDAAKQHSWKETEKKLANSNIDDGKMAPSDMKRPNSKDNACITSDPAAILTGPAFVQHMMELDEADESSMKFMEVQDVAPRMEKLIVKMVQNRKITNNIVLSDEPETDELRGSKLKEWSQEEKDVFSEMIRTFGLNFSKVSSFLTHKTTADCMKYYSEHYKSECHKEAQKCLPTTVMQSQGNYSNENDAAPLFSGIETIKATKNSERMKAKEEVKKPVNKISHESTASLLAHSLRDKGHGESSMDENEHLTGKVVLGESNAAPSALGMRSSQAACLTISKTEAPVLENFNEDSCPNKAVCITKSSSKVHENEPQSVLIANHGDEGNCVAGGSCGQDNLKITFFPDERSAKLAKGTIKGDQIRSGAKTAELCSSLKECNDAAKHHSGEATEKKLANSNIDDGRVAPSDMKNPNSKDNPCITSDPAAILTGPAFVQHMMELDEAMEKKESEKNDDSVNGKEGNNPVLCVASKHGSGIQLSCEVNSQKEMEKVDSIPSPEGNDLSTDTETLTKESGPRVATNDDGLIQRLRASEAMYRHPENNDAKVINNKENPVHSVALKESNGIQLSCDVTAKKGKGMIPSPEVIDLNAPPMQISYGAPNTYHLPSSSGSAALDMVHANSSYVAMDIDLNIPLDMTPTDVTSVDLRSSTAEAAMGCRSEATDSHTTMEITQTYQQQPASANQPGSVLLFGRVIYQPPPSTGTVVTSRNAVVPVIRPRGRGQAYASWATTTTIWRNSIPYGSSTSGASRSAAPPLQLQPGSSASALINMMNQQRQQDLANITPISIVRGGVPVVHSQLIPGSSGGARFVNFNGFNSVQPQWPYPVVGTSRVVIGHPFYYPGATANQAPATVTTILSIGTNNGEGASTSNARAPPAAGGGRGRGGHNSWLSLRRN